MEMTLILEETELNAILLAKIEAGKQADSTVVFKGDQFADFVAHIERGEQPDSRPYQIPVKVKG